MVVKETLQKMAQCSTFMLTRPVEVYNVIPESLITQWLHSFPHAGVVFPWTTPFFIRDRSEIRHEWSSLVFLDFFLPESILKNYEDTRKFVVISSWDSVEDWMRWASSHQRLEIQNQIDSLLGEQTEYGIYVYA